MLARMERRATSLLIVCHGNLCRSPMAQALVRHWASNRDASDRIVADSAGIRPFQPGGPAHPQTIAMLEQNGVDARGLTCRGLAPDDFTRFDRVLAVDRFIARQLEQRRTVGAPVELLLRYGASGELDVPDPYLDGRFAEVFALLDDACRGLVDACLSGQ
jgi:protein-tyrosine phosphatase